MKYLETDMFEPVRKYFECGGYKVNAEVKGCDVTAYKLDEIIVVELKSSFNMKLIYQGLERRRITENVYLAVPRPKMANSKSNDYMRKVCAALGFGLLFVAMDSPVKSVDVIMPPLAEVKAANVLIRKSAAKKRAVIDEINKRAFDTNKGGSSRIKLNTAYRERCIKIACIMEQRGSKRANELIRNYGCEKDAYNIMYANNYGWFVRISKGVYDLSDAGRSFLAGGEFREQVNYYRMLYVL